MTEADKIIRATEVNARIARATIRMQAMLACNQQRVSAGHCIAYTEEAIFAVIDEEGIGHNAVIASLYE